MANLTLTKDLPTEALASNLRKAMSGIVAGNVKTFGVEQISKYGPYQLNAQPQLIEKLDVLLKSFVAQDRMKLPSNKPYKPCYQVN
jgi:hypothetical protein